MSVLVASAKWSRTDDFVLRITGALAFTLLTILSAQVRIPLPFTPVPMTLQTFVVPLAGAMLGVGWGLFSILLYIGLGIAGFQVFAAASAGPQVFFTATGGYLLGFALASAFMGSVREYTSKLPFLLGALFVAHLLILACGMGGLMANLGLTPAQAFSQGVAPFLVGDVLKIAASVAVLKCYRLCR
jgi:biotin transport system substrate-specific component